MGCTCNENASLVAAATTSGGGQWIVDSSSIVVKYYGKPSVDDETVVGFGVGYGAWSCL